MFRTAAREQERKQELPSNLLHKHLLVVGRHSKVENVTTPTDEEARRVFGHLKAVLSSVFAHHQGLLWFLAQELAVGRMIEDFLSRVTALENHFDVPPSDVTEQRRRDGVIRYATIPPVVLCAEFFLASFRTSRGNWS